jgi:putative RecB family exonuclease
MPVYSHSRLGTFESCPLMYKFSYIDKIKRDQEGVEAFMGLRFHEVMELLYKDINFKTHTLKDLLCFYDSNWRKEWHDEIVITKKDRTEKDYYNLGKKCIEDYYKRYYPFNSSRVLSLERKISIQLDEEGKYKLTGYIDRVSQDPKGTYEIHDYKTAGTLPAQKYLDEDRQLALYQIGIQNIWNDVKNVNLIWHYVVFDKEMISTRSSEQLAKLKQDIIGLIDTVESTTEFTPNESGLCAWCSYPDLCPKRKHLYKVEALPVNEYLGDDGVKLVNTFASLSADKKKLNEEISKIDDELEKVKEAVYEYAEKEGADVIAGSSNKLKVSEKQKLIFPAKGSPERDEIKNILCQADKWDEVAKMDIPAVEKAVLEQRWDKTIIDKVKAFLRLEIKKSVSLSKHDEKEK